MFDTIEKGSGGRIQRAGPYHRDVMQKDSARFKYSQDVKPKTEVRIEDDIQVLSLSDRREGGVVHSN